jgi:hypothetical protein
MKKEPERRRFREFYAGATSRCQSLETWLSGIIHYPAEVRRLGMWELMLETRCLLCSMLPLMQRVMQRSYRVGRPEE